MPRKTPVLPAPVAPVAPVAPPAPVLPVVPEDAWLSFVPVEEPKPSGRSVVSQSAKAKWRERGNARGCGDWLHDLLAEHTLDKHGKLVVDAFDAFLAANGVDGSKWSRTTPGWQGRLRMSGRLAAQAKIASSGWVVLPDGTRQEAPAAWVARILR